MSLALRAHPPIGTVPVTAALTAGRRTRARRRLLRGGGLGVVVVAVAAALALAGLNDGQFRLVGDGLTLSSGSGVTQVTDDRVDMGDQVTAWRADGDLMIGYLNGTHATLSPADPVYRFGWHDLAHDKVVLGPAETPDGRTLAMGHVRGEPESVTVSTPRQTFEATVARSSSPLSRSERGTDEKGRRRRSDH
ncbi:hypothetical protein CC117_28450 [Parafrankia colletiae]|uniref:Uncharacterized protein n=2 Tax=Parafrankia colletiae TaxID=573497 RepID=A0A1S1Q730_9ACTN|nr:hypothetical protein [Frankia sp. Cpl3]OHV29750.1 hypothetical protein CC117_28450 [Parafrankia colletiae]